MKYIAAIDGSSCATRAFEILLEIFNQNKDEMTLICVGPNIDMNEEYKCKFL